MKVKALANLSTVNGPKIIGDEFVVNAADAAELIERGLVEQVVDTPPVVEELAGKAEKRKRGE